MLKISMEKQNSLGKLIIPDALLSAHQLSGGNSNTNHGLIEWFLSQEGKTVSGYKKAIFSGLTTMALSEIIGKIISDYPDLHGVRRSHQNPSANMIFLIW